MITTEQTTQNTASAKAATLTRGGLLARNTVWNLAGQVAPMAVGLIAIPRLIHALGTDRFGALTIAWMVVGYFSFFDLGLGRAMTNLVAQKLGNEETELPAIIWTSNLLIGLLGCVGGVVLALLSPVLVRHLLKTPHALQGEISTAFYVLSISVPFVVSTAGFRGILEARQKFSIVNLVRIPLGIGTLAGPLIVLPWTNNLIAVVIVLVLLRVAFWIAYAFCALYDMPGLWHSRQIDSRIFPKLFAFGTWMTVSNIVSPVMSYLDRFLVGGMLSLTAVTYYATPFEVTTKLLVVPAAVVGVLFPAFSTALVSDRARACMLFEQAVRYVFVLLYPLTFLIVLYAHNGLSIWLGSIFADHSTHVMQLLTIGVLSMSLANLPFALIQGAGRADLTGKLHLIELPIYIATVCFLTKHFGIRGTAVAWTLRSILDCVLLFWTARRLLDYSVRVRQVIVCFAGVAMSFALAMLAMGIITKSLEALVILSAYFWAVWCHLLANEERSAVKRIFSQAVSLLAAHRS